MIAMKNVLRVMILFQQKVEAATTKSSTSTRSILESVLPVHCMRLCDDSLQQIASASLQSVLSSDVAERMQDSLDSLKEGELKTFADEVVTHLYQARILPTIRDICGQRYKL